MAAFRAAGTAFGEKGVVFNLTADFGPTIRDGLLARISEMEARIARCRAEGDAEGVKFLSDAILSATAVLELADRYRAAAAEQGFAKGDRRPALRRDSRTPSRRLPKPSRVGVGRFSADPRP